jgi:hypothetical protein
MTRSVAKSSTNMRKLPLNAEITRFSAGRVSRSAEYGVVIKDIRKTVQGEELSSNPPSYEQTDTLRTYQDTLRAVHNVHISVPSSGNIMTNQYPTGNVRVIDQTGILTNNQYLNHSLAPAHSKAVFAAPDELYAKPCKPARMITIQHPQQTTMDLCFPILTQQALLLQ